MLMTCLLLVKKKVEIEVLKKLHNIAFNMKNLGNVKKKLGVEIIRVGVGINFLITKEVLKKGFKNL